MSRSTVCRPENGPRRLDGWPLSGALCDVRQKTCARPYGTEWIAEIVRDDGKKFLAHVRSTTRLFLCVLEVRDVDGNAVQFSAVPCLAIATCAGVKPKCAAIRIEHAVVCHKLRSFGDCSAEERQDCLTIFWMKVSSPESWFQELGHREAQDSSRLSAYERETKVFVGRPANGMVNALNEFLVSTIARHP